MKKKYIDFKKTLLYSGCLAFGMLTLVSFKSGNLEKTTNTEAFLPIQGTELYSVKINFQDKNTTPPDGYLKDYGKEFGFTSANTIGADYQYGWKLLSTDQPYDASNEAAGNFEGVGRNRLGNAYATATTQEKLEGTLVHFQGNDVIANGVREWAGQPRGNDIYWEIQVPDGTYTVTVGLGDKSMTNLDSRHSATVEGYTIISAFVPTAGQTKTGTITVQVSDGLLTLKGLGGFNSKIDYIEITEDVVGVPATGELSFTPAASQLNVDLGNTGSLTTSLVGVGTTDIGLTIDNNLNKTDNTATGTNDWISLPNMTLPGEYVFPVTASTFDAGDTRSNNIIATAVGYKPAVFSASLLVGCPPLSILSCDELVKTVPVNLEFSGTDGGLMDASSADIGFTLATPHSGARTTADGVFTYGKVNGYEPSKLTITGGNLAITATQGIAAGATNNQVNTLGVGIQINTAPIQIETKMLGIDTGAAGFPQAGINFGFNEENFVKLVVINNTIELRKEIGDVSQNGDNNADNIIVKNLDIRGKDVSLTLVVDPMKMTLTGYYAIDGGDLVRMEGGNRTSLTLPQTLLDGRDVSNDFQAVSLAGVFASYNKATSGFTATFDYFNVIPAILSIDPINAVGSQDIVLYPNPASTQINLKIAQSVGSVKNITIFDIQGRAVSKFEPSKVKTNNGFRIPTADLKTGVYFVQLQKENGDKEQIRFIANN